MVAKQVIILALSSSDSNPAILDTLAASAIYPPTTTLTASTLSRTGGATMRPQRRSMSI